MAVLLLVATAEGGARWAASPRSGPPVLPEFVGVLESAGSDSWALRPDPGSADPQWTTDSAGHRLTPGGQADVAAQPRVLVLGGSAAAGVGVADRDAFPSLFARAVRDQLPTLEVTNLGVPGFGTEQALQQLQAAWETLRPEIVVFVVSPGLDPAVDLLGPGAFGVVEGKLRATSWRPADGSVYNNLRSESTRPLFAHHLPGDSGLRRRSALYRAVQQLASESLERRATRWPYGMQPFDETRWGANPWLMLQPLPPPMDAAWRITADVLGKARVGVERKGAHLVVLGVPPRVAVDAAELASARLQGWRPVDWDRGGREIAVEQPMALLSRVCEGAAIPLVIPRLSDAARRERLYLPGSPGWAPPGHREAAWALAEGLARLGWVPPLDLARVRGALRKEVPPGPPPQRLADPGPGRKDGEGKGGKGIASEVSPRFVEQERLEAVLVKGAQGWTCSPARVEDDSLPEPREEVVVRTARARCRPPGASGDVEIFAMDGANQAEFSEVLRAEGRTWITSPLPRGLPRFVARLALGSTPPVASWEGFSTAPLEALEAELGAVDGGEGPRVVVGDGPVPPERMKSLVQPEELLPTLPAAPPGWQALDAVPIYRPHDLHAGEAPVPPDVELLLRDTPGVDRRPGTPWTAQVKRWYRGPAGSFEAVVQDCGRQERLLRAREARLRPFVLGLVAGTIHDGDEDGPSLRQWSGAGLVGFRTCKEAQGLCKVVAPLIDPSDPLAAVARWNLILMGPASARDEDFALLAAGVVRDRLPIDPPSPPP